MGNETEIVKGFLDYGIAIGTLIAVIIWLLGYFIPKQNKNFSELQEQIRLHSEQIAALTHAVDNQTVNMINLMKTCEKTLEDNRRILETLLNRQNQ